MIVRACKIVMLLCLSVFALLVTYTNVLDYDANFEGLRVIMTMETTFPGNAAMDRAVTSERLWRVAYGIIIAGEGLTGLLLLLAALWLLGALKAPAAEFNRRKSLAVLGVTMGFLVWYGLFTIVAGEWFLMWQSKTLNALPTAFRIYMSFLAVLIFVMMPDQEP